MLDWNVVVTVQQQGYQEAISLLKQYGPVSRTQYFNVLVLRAENISEMTEDLQQRVENYPDIIEAILARVVPVIKTFHFSSPEEFEKKARETALAWVPKMTGKSFHVRMHRRGFKGRLSSLEEERFLDDVLLQALEKLGKPAAIDFDDPDLILVLETIDQRAGLSLWTRDDLERYPFLHLD